VCPAMQARVRRIVVKELPDRTVESVRTRPKRRIHLGSSGAASLRGKVARHRFESSNCFRWKLDHIGLAVQLICAVVIVVDAIKQKMSDQNRDIPEPGAYSPPACNAAAARHFAVSSLSESALMKTPPTTLRA